jgi:hypothetical protein
MTDEPQRTYLLFSRTYACRIGWLLQPAISQESRDRARQNPGKQVLAESGGTSDAALNAGGPSVYLWEDAKRYRLFLRTAAEVVHGDEYIAEGVYAQKAIDEIGDPDQGKNGYPLQSSCESVVTMAWSGLPFDAIDAQAAVLRATVKRLPADSGHVIAQLLYDCLSRPAGTMGPKPRKEHRIVVGLGPPHLIAAMGRDNRDLNDVARRNQART